MPVPVCVTKASFDGMDMSSNKKFMFVHGWTTAPLLMEFSQSFMHILAERATTVEELAREMSVEAGPLSIVLRTCTILGYVNFDHTTYKYRATVGPELEELGDILGSNSTVTKAIRSIYDTLLPPFCVPSEQASHCLTVWADHRPSWKSSKSKVICVFLDGVVLVPLFASLLHSRLSCGPLTDLGLDGLDTRSRTVFAEMLVELGIGSINSAGSFAVTPADSAALQRFCLFCVPASYSPLLAKVPYILRQDAAWGFGGAGLSETESPIHVKKTLHAFGTNIQLRTLFQSLDCGVGAAFGGEDFESQPNFIAGLGCGEAHLLLQLYRYIRENTPRGRVVGKYPLKVICVESIESNTKRLAEVAATFRDAGIPHMMVSADVEKPADIRAALEKQHVSWSGTLHVRALLDRGRFRTHSTRRLVTDSAVEAFALAQLRDFVYLDERGHLISPCEVFASIVEHFERWGVALKGSPGLYALEATGLDVPTTERCLSNSPSLHTDILHSLSREHSLTAPAFAMAAAMAGLLPKDMKNVRTGPDDGQCCSTVEQHLIRRPFKIRLAEEKDMPRLIALDKLVWANLRTAPKMLMQHLINSPTTNLVCTLNEKVVAALYMQRIADVEVTAQQQFESIHDAHTPTGKILQLIAISADPEVAHIGVGSDLRAFALHLARLDPTIECVVAVTRARNFINFPGSMQDYVNKHVHGTLVDPIINFHTSYGAEVQHLVHNFRPEDMDNGGIGVLVKYALKHTAHARPLVATPRSASNISTQDLVVDIMADLGYSMDLANLSKGFWSFGLDSLDVVHIREKLEAAIGKRLPSTLLLDCPTVSAVCKYLDKHRKVDVQEAVARKKSGGFDAITADELIAMQRECKRAYAQPQYQRRLAKLASKYYPDMMKYINAIDPITIEIEGPLFLKRGLIEDTGLQTVQKARGEMTRVISKYWSTVPQVRALGNELFHLTKQDQVWE